MHWDPDHFDPSFYCLNCGYRDRRHRDEAVYHMAVSDRTSRLALTDSGGLRPIIFEASPPRPATANDMVGSTSTFTRSPARNSGACDTPNPTHRIQASGPTLTSREEEILGMAGQGLRNQEIADELVLSLRTVESHLRRAYGKLGLFGKSARAAAVAHSRSRQRR